MGLFSWLFRPPSREKFAAIMMRELRRRGDQRPMTFDAEQFCIRLGGSEHKMYLHNAYVDYCAAPRSKRTEVLDRYSAIVDLQKKNDPTFEEAKGRLLPRLRERAYFSSFALNTRIERLNNPPAKAVKAPLDNFVIRPYAEHLTLELVQDFPQAIGSVSRDVMAKWGKSFDELIALARDNLWQRSNSDFRLIAPGLFISPYQDTHDASRMFLHDLIWQLPVKGNHIAAIPNRDVLLVTGSEDEAGLLAMATLMDDILQKPRPMTGTIFCLEGSQWKPFLPSPQSSAHWALRSVAMRNTSRDYAEQKQMLETLHKKSGQDIFVAKQTLMKRKDGTYWTWAVWVEEVADALMPQADYVNFGSVAKGKESHGWGVWNRVREVAGHRMEETDLFPPMYRIRSYPTQDELAAMELQEASP